MFEFDGLTPSDDFAETGEFDKVYEYTEPSLSIPIGTSGEDFVLTPANTAVRMFFGSQEDYSRVIVYPGDGSTAPFKPDDGFLKYLVCSGFPVELPDKLDETDTEFMNDFMKVWNEDAYAELKEFQ